VSQRHTLAALYKSPLGAPTSQALVAARLHPLAGLALQSSGRAAEGGLATPFVDRRLWLLRRMRLWAKRGQVCAPHVTKRQTLAMPLSTPKFEVRGPGQIQESFAVCLRGEALATQVKKKKKKKTNTWGYFLQANFLRAKNVAESPVSEIPE
jgi:hypothetical protein